MYSNLFHSDATLYIVIGLLLSNYMLIKNQRNNLKKFIIVFLFSNIWGGLNLYSMYEHINGIEKINILCTLLLILAGEYIFYYRYKKGTLEGISKIYFDINNFLSIIIVVSFSIIGIVFLLWELLKWILWKNYFFIHLHYFHWHPLYMEWLMILWLVLRYTMTFTVQVLLVG